MNPLVLIGEAEFLQSVNLLLDHVVLGCGDSTVQLAVIGLKESSVEHILSLTLSQLTLEKNMTLLPITINTVSENLS